MNSQEARQQLEAAQTALADLQEQQEAMTQEIEALTSQRAAALRAVARGDGGQRKAYWAAEEQAKVKEQQLKDLAVSITEAEAAASQAREGLAAAEAQEKAAALARAEAAERAECERLRAELPQRKSRLYEGYRDLCLAIGSYMIDVARITGTPPTVDDAFALRTSMQQMAAADGLALLSLPGPLINLQNWGMVRVNGDFSQPQQGGVDLMNFVNWQKAKARQGYLKEQTNELS